MQSVNQCLESVKRDYLKFLNKEKIFSKSKENKIKNLKNFYIPIAFWIDKKYKEKGKTLFLGFSGSQGSGKTTAAGILKVILKKFFKREIHVSSIDDFYKTFKDREKMSHKIHPLLKTRGVPGTHDVNLTKNFFKVLSTKKFKKIMIPKFDKSIDDRLEKKYCYKIKKKPEIVILEGWCVGAKPQSKNLIKKSINILEKKEDTNLTWRKYVNEKLKNDYKKVFSMLDHFIYMKIPNFNVVFKWRLLQEKKLRKKSYSKKKIMTPSEIKRFIMFYQRITLQMTKDLSKSASIVMFLKKNQDIKKVLFR